MKSALKILTILALLAAVVLVAAPAQASNASGSCMVDPASGPVGTAFTISCNGFSANATTNVYGVEPDGRASGLNIYGFFPTVVKADKTGTATFTFRTSFPGFFSAPVGHYTFVVQELVPDGGGKIAVLDMAQVDVTSPTQTLAGAVLMATHNGWTKDGVDWFTVMGTGYAPFEPVSIWVTQPPATQCSGLGIDQLTLGALAGNGSSLWTAPGTVKASAAGDITFDIGFRTSACVGEHWVSARALHSGIGGAIALLVEHPGPSTMNAIVLVSPGKVPAFHSLHTVMGSGFPASTIVNCWYTRPDGRVLSFINVNAKTDASGSFSTKSSLDDFPPFTGTEPGIWAVTCATPDKSSLGIGFFEVFSLMPDP